MRRVAAVLAVWLIVATSGCLPAGDVPKPKPTVQAQRLVLATTESRRAPTMLRAIDPDTLADSPGLEPLEVPRCSGALTVQPGGGLAAFVSGAPGYNTCEAPGNAELWLLDLNAWAWRPAIALPTATEDSIYLDSGARRSIGWSADGRSVYILTRTQSSEERRLWLIDVSGASQPLSVRLDFPPARLDVVPNGSAIFILGATAAAGSGFLAIYDPKTLAERIRVPLSGLNLGAPDAPLRPGVAVAPDGSRYYVAHADRAVLDVVDTRAPRLERLERTIALRIAASTSGDGSWQAWLGVSPDGSHLYTWRQAATPDDNLGLQEIDTRTWQVTTLDPVAERLGTSLNGHWLFELDPPAWTRPGATPPQQRGPRDFSGARLSVLDAVTRAEVATLMRDEFPLNPGQYGTDRVYLSQLGRGRSQSTLIAYDVQSWREVARRTLDSSGWLATTSPLW